MWPLHRNSSKPNKVNLFTKSNFDPTFLFGRIIEMPLDCFLSTQALTDYSQMHNLQYFSGWHEVEHWRAAVKSGLQGGPHCFAQPILTRESGTSRISKQFILRADIFSSDSLQQLYPPTGPHRFPVTYILSKLFRRKLLS